jgi:indoleamine 2,3-dioxygenase
VLSIESIQGDLRRLQRAHLVLAWLVHYFVHSIPLDSDEPRSLIPRALAIPLVEVSRKLGIAPILTYADTVLWNWERIRPDQPTSIENIQSTHVFSGSDDERHFYMASARIELRGAEVLGIIDDYETSPSNTDLNWISKTARNLTRLAGIINEMTDIMLSIRGGCDPHIFYWAIRPWYEGNPAHKKNEQEWEYEGVPNAHDLDLDGPSGGQSSVFHALDLFLDVDHKLQQRRLPAPSDSNSKAERGFMERMRRYMPGKHREYLARIRTIRELAKHTPMLQEPYDLAVRALKELRDAHMRIACLYIVTMSRSDPSRRPGCPVSAMMEKMRKMEDGPVRGTGGTELCALLKAGRDATRRTMLKQHSRH